MDQLEKTLTININLATKEFDKKMEESIAKIDKQKEGLKAFKEVLGKLPGAFQSFGIEAVKVANELQGSLSKVESIFGKNSGLIKNFAQNALSSFGIAQSSALEMASDFGGVGRIMNLNRNQAAAMSTQLVALAGDLASFRNVEAEVAGSALKNAIKGDTDALADLGITMTNTQLQSFAAANGIKEAYSHMNEGEKAALRYGFILDQTKNIQGEFGRSGGGAASQMFIFTQSVKQLYTSFGEVLLPVFNAALGVINQLIQGFAGLDPVGKKTILLFAGLGVAVPMLKSAFEKVSTVINGLRLTFGAMTAPIAIATVAIVAITAIIIKNWSAIKQSLIDVGVWSTLSNLVKTGLGMIIEVVDLFGNILSGNWEGVWENITNIVKGIWNNIVNIVAGAVKGVALLTAGFFETLGIRSFRDEIVDFNKSVDDMANKFLVNTDKLTQNAKKVTNFLGNLGTFDWTKVFKGGGGGPDPELLERERKFKEFMERLKQIQLENAIPDNFLEEGERAKEAYKVELNRFQDFLCDKIISNDQYNEYLKESWEKYNRDVDAIYDKVKMKPIPMSFTSDESGIKDRMQAKLDNVMSQASIRFPAKTFTDAERDAFQVGTIMAEGVKNAIGAGLDGLAGLFEGIFTSAFGGKFDYKKLFSGVLSTIGDLMIATGKATILQGVAITALENLQGIGAIAAGVALIAGGALLKSASSSFSKGTDTNSSLSAPSASRNAAPSYSNNVGANMNVAFEIQGTKLVGVLNNTNQAWGR